VLAIDLKECPEWGLIIGYEMKNDETRFLCKTLFDDTYS